MNDATKSMDAVLTAVGKDAAAVRQAAGQAKAAAQVEMRQAQGWLRRHVWALLGVAVALAAIAVVLAARR